MLFILIALGAPVVGAQQSRADSLLVAGASVRFRTDKATPRKTEALIVARRGDTLDLRLTTNWGANPTVSTRPLDWRTLHALEARRVSAADGSGDGAAVGFLLGAAIGAASAKSSAGSLDFRLSTNPGLLRLAGGLLGGIVGLMVDSSVEGAPGSRSPRPDLVPDVARAENRPPVALFATMLARGYH